MTLTPDKISKFWKELKRRRVVHVTIIYISATALILDLVNNIADPLNLPAWTPTLIIVLLAIGFPIALIFSWIFDVTPEGLEKTKPVEDDEEVGVHTSVKGVSVGSGWRIATFVSLFVIVGLVVLHIMRGGSRVDASLEKSIAILPVHNLSGDPAQDYICDGLTREIISRLCKIGSFDKVISYQTMNTYKNSEKSIPEIATERGVNYVLDPSYMRIGDKMTVVVDLVNAKTDQPIWNDEFRRDYKEIISLDSDIALELAKKLYVYISGEEEERIEKSHTENLEAYELVQKAQYYFFGGQWMTDTLFQLRDTIEKAIALDPDYATPYVLMATFSLFKFTGMNEPLHDFRPAEMFEYNYEALRRDPENTGAILIQALYEQWVEWDYVECERQYQKAFTIEPNSRNYYLIRSYIEFLFKMERYGEMPAYMEKLDEPHPREVQILDALGEHDKAERLAKREMEKEHHTPQIQWVIEYYLWQGAYDRVRKFMDSQDMSIAAFLNSPIMLAYRALTYHQTGNIAAARELVEQLKLYSETDQYGMPEFNLGRYYSGIGENDSAFYWLFRAYEEQCVEMSWLRADKLLRKLDGDDRYWDLYERAGFKAYDEYRVSLESGNP